MTVRIRPLGNLFPERPHSFLDTDPGLRVSLNVGHAQSCIENSYGHNHY
jgi:hypothetical protein